MKYWIYISLTCVVFLFNLKKYQSTYKKIEHQVFIEHPGEKVAVPTILTEVQNENKIPVSYYADVESVICLEQVCKVIPVRLFWNNVGEYQKYELAEGKTLEKYEADLFDPEDYDKIHSIMSNPDSPFKDVYIDEILTVPHENEADVDAVSGATALVLNEKDTVPGAALTCYTLWHWANGDMVSKIKKQTGVSVSDEQLYGFISEDNSAYFQIALQEFQNRNLYSKEIIDEIINKALLDKSLVNISVAFFEKAPSETYFYAIKRLFTEGDKKQRLIAITSLKQVEFEVSKDYLDTFSYKMEELGSYQEIAMVLGLMEVKNLNSKKVVANTLPLLDSDFLIARRAYWFLKNQELTQGQRKQVNQFQEKYKDKL